MDAKRIGGIAGVVGTVLFVAVFLIEGALRPGYDPVRMHISDLALGERGWVQTANFLIYGLRDAQPVTDSSDCLDVARTFGIVAEFPAQHREVACKAVASAAASGALPECFRQLLVSHDDANSGCQRVEKDVLRWGEPNLARPLANGSAEGVNL